MQLQEANVFITSTYFLRAFEFLAREGEAWRNFKLSQVLYIQIGGQVLMCKGARIRAACLETLNFEQEIQVDGEMQANWGINL